LDPAGTLPKDKFLIIDAPCTPEQHAEILAAQSLGKDDFRRHMTMFWKNLPKDAQTEQRFRVKFLPPEQATEFQSTAARSIASVAQTSEGPFPDNESQVTTVEAIPSKRAVPSAPMPVSHLDLEGDYTRLLARVTDLEQQLASVQQDSVEQRTHKEKAESDLLELQGEVSNLQAQLQRERTTIHELSAVKSELHAAASRASDAEGKLAHMVAALAEANGQGAQREHAAKALQTEVEKLKGELAAALAADHAPAVTPPSTFLSLLRVLVIAFIGLILGYLLA
jgi:hypothetical protein